MFTLSQQACAVEFLRSLGPSLSPHINMRYPDAQIKYSYILQKVISLNLGPESRILDIGCGDGQISRTMANLGYTNVIGVDAVRRRVIKDRPERPKTILFRTLGKLKNGDLLGGRQRYKFIRCDALSFLNSQVPESFDLVIDGCSITHFDTRVAGDSWPLDVNFGFVQSLKNIERILRPNGALISAMDVLPSAEQEMKDDKEFFSEQSMREVVKTIFRNSSFDEHSTAWDGASEHYKFIVSHKHKPLTLGISGFTASR